MTPHREPDPAAGDQDAVHLGDRAGGRAPDAAEAGDDVEGVVVPGQGVHVADPQVSVGAAVPGHGEEAWRRIDPRAPGAAQASQLHREARPAGDVEQPVTGVDAQAVVHGDVLPAVGRFAEGGELHGLPAPALVDTAPAVVRRRGWRRHDPPSSVATSGGRGRG